MSDQEKLAAQQAFTLKKMGIANQYDLQKLAAQYNLNSAKGLMDFRMDMAKNGADATQISTAVRSATGDWSGASGSELLSAPDGTLIPSRLKQTTNPNNGKECAEFVNDITGA